MTHLFVHFFFFNDTATTEIYTLSLHDALPILNRDGWPDLYVANDFFERDYLYINQGDGTFVERLEQEMPYSSLSRSEEHTSELQSRLHLVCRLLLEKKKHRNPTSYSITTILTL